MSVKWDCTAVVYIRDGMVTAEDETGEVIHQAPAGAEDAAVIQTALDHAGADGEIKVKRGDYKLQESVVIHSAVTFRGEGRGTVFLPPAGDYAFKVMTTDKTGVDRPYEWDSAPEKKPGPNYAVIMGEFAIDGEKAGGDRTGKGIYFTTFWSSSFSNMWIERTSTAIHTHRIHESDWQNIYMIHNGNAEKQEPTVLLEHQCDNQHMRGIYVIYPNYIGMELRGNPENASDCPRLVFITHSMFHGWLERMGKRATAYPLIQLTDIDNTEGRTDTVLSDCRTTVVGEGAAAINVVNSPLSIRGGVLTSTRGSSLVNASAGARVRIDGANIYNNSGTGGDYVVHAKDAEVLFKNNNVVGERMQLCLAPGTNSIIADNRFDNGNEQPCVSVGRGSRNVRVSGNAFLRKNESAALDVSEETKHVILKDNFFAE